MSKTEGGKLSPEVEMKEPNNKLGDWCAEFYPITAEMAARTLNPVGLVEHGLTKWRGLLPENLEKHGLFVNDMGDIEDSKGEIIIIDASSCALCKTHLRKTKAACCGKCPLYLLDGDCSGSTRWRDWMVEHNPKPMIEALERTLAYVKNKQEN